MVRPLPLTTAALQGGNRILSNFPSRNRTLRIHKEDDSDDDNDDDNDDDAL